MAHLEKLFNPEGQPPNHYKTVDTQMTYKSESSSSESRDVQPVKKDFLPVTTEIHVTELRPIKLDTMPKSRDGNTHQTWERRLLSESAMSDVSPRAYSESSGQYHNESRQESRSETRRSHSASSRGITESLEGSEADLQGNMIRTVTSRARSYSGSSGSSPSATLSSRDKGTAEFRRRGRLFTYKVSLCVPSMMFPSFTLTLHSQPSGFKRF